MKRRSLLTLGAGAALTAAFAPTVGAATSRNTDELTRRLRALEREYAARLGVFARNTATGETVRHRADERFPMCSVFKALAAGSVLRDLDHNGEFLAKRVHYTEKDATEAGYAPITGRPENIAEGMTVEQLCAAAVSHSDNGAANLLLRELGGPTAITRFARSIGDDTTRLDRWEPDLNSAEPWRVTDTTTARAIGTSLTELISGDALEPADRRRLTDWMIANTTNTDKFRAGLPNDWTIADKTGGGSAYGVNNDAGVVWPPNGPALTLSVLSSMHTPDAVADDALIARAAEVVAGHLV